MPYSYTIDGNNSICATDIKRHEKGWRATCVDEELALCGNVTVGAWCPDEMWIWIVLAEGKTGYILKDHDAYLGWESENLKRVPGAPSAFTGSFVVRGPCCESLYCRAEGENTGVYQRSVLVEHNIEW